MFDRLRKTSTSNTSPPASGKPSGSSHRKKRASEEGPLRSSGRRPQEASATGAPRAELPRQAEPEQPERIGYKLEDDGGARVTIYYAKDRRTVVHVPQELREGVQQQISAGHSEEAVANHLRAGGQAEAQWIVHAIYANPLQLAVACEGDTWPAAEQPMQQPGPWGGEGHYPPATYQSEDAAAAAEEGSLAASSDAASGTENSGSDDETESEDEAPVRAGPSAAQRGPQQAAASVAEKSSASRTEEDSDGENESDDDASVASKGHLAQDPMHPLRGNGNFDGGSGGKDKGKGPETRPEPLVPPRPSAPDARTAPRQAKAGLAGGLVPEPALKPAAPPPPARQTSAAAASAVPGTSEAEGVHKPSPAQAAPNAEASSGTPKNRIQQHEWPQDSAFARQAQTQGKTVDEAVEALILAFACHGAADIDHMLDNAMRVAQAYLPGDGPFNAKAFKGNLCPTEKPVLAMQSIEHALRCQSADAALRIISLYLKIDATCAQSSPVPAPQPQASAAAASQDAPEARPAGAKAARPASTATAGPPKGAAAGGPAARQPAASTAGQTVPEPHQPQPAQAPADRPGRPVSGPPGRVPDPQPTQASRNAAGAKPVQGSDNGDLLARLEKMISLQLRSGERAALIAAITARWPHNNKEIEAVADTLIARAAAARPKEADAARPVAAQPQPLSTAEDVRQVDPRGHGPAHAASAPTAGKAPDRQEPVARTSSGPALDRRDAALAEQVDVQREIRSGDLARLVGTLQRMRPNMGAAEVETLARQFMADAEVVPIEAPPPPRGSDEWLKTRLGVMRAIRAGSLSGLVEALGDLLPTASKSALQDRAQKLMSSDGAGPVPEKTSVPETPPAGKPSRTASKGSEEWLREQLKELIESRKLDPLAAKIGELMPRLSLDKATEMARHLLGEDVVQPTAGEGPHWFYPPPHRSASPGPINNAKESDFFGPAGKAAPPPGPQSPRRSRTFTGDERPRTRQREAPSAADAQQLRTQAFARLHLTSDADWHQVLVLGRGDALKKMTRDLEECESRVQTYRSERAEYSRLVDENERKRDDRELSTQAYRREYDRLLKMRNRISDGFATLKSDISSLGWRLGYLEVDAAQASQTLRLKYSEDTVIGPQIKTIGLEALGKLRAKLLPIKNRLEEIQELCNLDKTHEMAPRSRALKKLGVEAQSDPVRVLGLEPGNSPSLFLQQIENCEKKRGEYMDRLKSYARRLKESNKALDSSREYGMQPSEPEVEEAKRLDRWADKLAERRAELRLDVEWLGDRLKQFPEQVSTARTTLQKVHRDYPEYGDLIQSIVEQAARELMDAFAPVERRFALLQEDWDPSKADSAPRASTSRRNSRHASQEDAAPQRPRDSRESTSRRGPRGDEPGKASAPGRQEQARPASPVPETGSPQASDLDSDASATAKRARAYREMELTPGAHWTSVFGLEGQELGHANRLSRKVAVCQQRLEDYQQFLAECVRGHYGDKRHYEQRLQSSREAVVSVISLTKRAIETVRDTAVNVGQVVKSKVMAEPDKHKIVMEALDAMEAETLEFKRRLEAFMSELQGQGAGQNDAGRAQDPVSKAQAAIEKARVAVKDARDAVEKARDDAIGQLVSFGLAIDEWEAKNKRPEELFGIRLKKRREFESTEKFKEDLENAVKKVKFEYRRYHIIQGEAGGVDAGDASKIRDLGNAVVDELKARIQEAQALIGLEQARADRAHS